MPTTKELPAIEHMPKGFFYFAVSSVAFLGFFGTFCNIFLFFKFATSWKTLNGFKKLCFMKTIANSIVCCSFLFFAVPVICATLTFSQVNYYLNRTMGMVSPLWSYILNTLIPICLSCNRFYFLYFPFGIKRFRTTSAINWAILICIIFDTALAIFSIPEGCGFVFDPNLFIWRSELYPCALDRSEYLPYINFSATIITNFFNIAIVIRLLSMSNSGVNAEESRARRKRWMVNFTQCVIQDSLQLFDTINAYYMWRFYDAAWYRFLFATLSFILVSALDGFVMFIYHQECLKLITLKWKSTTVEPSPVNSLPSGHRTLIE